MELPLPAGTPRRPAMPHQRAWLHACRGVTHTVMCIIQRGRGMAPAAQAAHGPGGGAAEGGHGASLTHRHAAPQRLAASARMATCLQGCNAYRHVYHTAGAGHGARGASSARPGRRGSQGRPRSFPYPPARRAAAPRRLSKLGYKQAQTPCMHGSMWHCRFESWAGTGSPAHPSMASALLHCGCAVAAELLSSGVQPFCYLCGLLSHCCVQLSSSARPPLPCRWDRHCPP